MTMIQPLNVRGGDRLTPILNNDLIQLIESRRIQPRMPHLDITEEDRLKRALIVYEDPLASARGETPRRQVILSPGKTLIVVGKPKAGKSTYTGMLATGAYTKDPLNSFGFMGVKDRTEIRWFDTEMDDEDVYSRHKEMQRRVTEDPYTKIDGLETFFLQGTSPEKKMDFILGVLEQDARNGIKVDIVFIDQLLDLTLWDDSTSGMQKVIEMIEHMKIRYNVAVVATAHTTFSSGKTNGAAGSHIEKKFGTKHLVDFDEENMLSHVETAFVRNGSHNINFKYYWDGGVVKLESTESPRVFNRADALAELKNPSTGGLSSALGWESTPAQSYIGSEADVPF